MLSIFDLRKIEIKTFEKLFYGGKMSAGNLAKQVEVSRTSIYDLLEKLLEKGLAIEIKELNIKNFKTQSPEKIELLIGEKEEEINSAKNELVFMQKEYDGIKKNALPEMQTYKGRDELRQMLKDILLYDDITIYGYWSIKNVTKVVGVKFFEEYHEKRIKQGIKLKTIWPESNLSSKKTALFLEEGHVINRDLRIAPQNIDFSLSYVIYANKIMFFSSPEENFGFIIESNELVKTMKQQYDVIWKISKPLKK